MLNRCELLRKIQTYDFNMQEAALFLHTNPCNRRAMEYYNFYRCLSDRATREYERRFGPLTNRSNNYSCNWQYIYEPWPWEREE